MSGQFEAPIYLIFRESPWYLMDMRLRGTQSRSRYSGVEAKTPCSCRESKSHCPVWVTLMVEVSLSSSVVLIRLCHRYCGTRSFNQAVHSVPSLHRTLNNHDSIFCTIVHEWKSLHTSVPCMYSNSWTPLFLSFLCDWHIYNWHPPNGAFILLWNLSYYVLYF
jgi:hypothetical protein